MTSSILISITLGIGLAASAGFRVFLPLLALSIAAHYQLLPLNEHWQWLGNPSAIIILGVATLAETAAALIPWVGNLLDALAVPLAGIAGTLIMVSTVSDLPQGATWALAVITGGGAALSIKGITTALKTAGNTLTGGFAGPIMSLIETITSLLITLLSLFLPLLALVLVVVILYALYRLIRRFRRRAVPAV